MLGVVVVGALALTSPPTLASDAMRSIDASGGNLVIQMPDNGARIIRVGTVQPVSAPPQHLRIISAPRDNAIAHIVAKPNSNCESAVVLRGRSFMYGIDRGETPVLDHPGCRYEQRRSAPGH
ncbi:hypothetical protein Q644_02315 [Brucella intermedia 229E]|uniref:Pilus formation protein N-terminal domain-containing protein n=1 Tax=Brucella intermedia 229E TaxID=1337887 RepID=U4VB33_9HYPH|nr:hypothetical protein Q644_02315 [Brucella intermedia 229E]